MPNFLMPGPYPLPGIAMPTWLVRYDGEGSCASPATADALMSELTVSDYSNILFYSHGWNTDFLDAVDQYKSFLAAFEQGLAERPVVGFKPIFVGITWPSVWMASDPGPAMARLGADDAAVDDILAVIAAPLSPPQRDRLYALTDAAAIDRAEAVALAQILTSAVESAPEEVDGGADLPLRAEDLLQGAARLADLERTARLLPLSDAAGFGPAVSVPVVAAGAAAAIDPRHLLRLFSLFQMKDRAGRVGATGVAVLLRRIQAAAPQIAVNVLGHSFGAKVMLSAICARPVAERPVDTLLLLQPAISHLAFANEVPGRAGPGGYRAALARVAAPILSTYSEMDKPLHDVFHLALRRGADLGEVRIAEAGEPPNKYAALGGYGPRRSSERLIRPIPTPGEDLGDLEGAEIVGLDGSGGQITSHGDVANRYTAWVLRSQIAGKGAAPKHP